MADPITLHYRGLPLVLTPVTDEEEHRTYGYGLTCPKCGKEFFLNTGIGRKPDHYLSRNASLLITIQPAIRCPFRCGWHVHIIDSVAYQCRRDS